MIEVHVTKGALNETYTLGDERIFIRKGNENKQLEGIELIQHVIEKANLIHKSDARRKP